MNEKKIQKHIYDEVVNLLASNLESQERVLQKIIDNNTRLFDLLDNGVESYE